MIGNIGNHRHGRYSVDAGANIEAKDMYGDSPLSWASWYLRPDPILRMLCYGDFHIQPNRRSMAAYLAGSLRHSTSLSLFNTPSHPLGKIGLEGWPPAADGRARIKVVSDRQIAIPSVRRQLESSTPAGLGGIRRVVTA